VSKFVTELELKLVNNKFWTLISSLIYESDLVGVVRVPVGFSTDLASVPRLPIIYSLWGAKAHREAVIHDYLFRSDSIPKTTFQIANKVFLEAMEARNKPFYIRYPMYYGVCVFSRSFFHKRKVNDKTVK